jgi:hypothetical protein
MDHFGGAWKLPSLKYSADTTQFAALTVFFDTHKAALKTKPGSTR